MNKYYFSTGTPDSTSGVLIISNHSYANRFSVNIDFVLEAMVSRVRKRGQFKYSYID